MGDAISDVVPDSPQSARSDMLAMLAVSMRQVPMTTISERRIAQRPRWVATHGANCAP